MKTEGRHIVEAPPAVVWSLLTDPLTLARILPGCESLEPVSSNEFDATIRLRVGSLVDSFAGRLTLRDLQPDERFRFTAHGTSPIGEISAQGIVSLSAKQLDKTELFYEADFAAEGAIAGASHRLRQTTLRAFTRRCLEELDHQAAIYTRVYTTTPPRAPESAVQVGAPSFDAPRYRQAMSLLLALTTVLLLISYWRRKSGHNQFDASQAGSTNVAGI